MFSFCIPQANHALMGEFSTSYVENCIASKYSELVIGGSGSKLTYIKCIASYPLNKGLAGLFFNVLPSNW